MEITDWKNLLDQHLPFITKDLNRRQCMIFIRRCMIASCFETLEYFYNCYDSYRFVYDYGGNKIVYGNSGERDIISERTKAGIARARLQNKTIGRSVGKKDKVPGKISGYILAAASRRKNVDVISGIHKPIDEYLL